MTTTCCEPVIVIDLFARSGFRPHFIKFVECITYKIHRGKMYHFKLKWTKTIFDPFCAKYAVCVHTHRVLCFFFVLVCFCQESSLFQLWIVIHSVCFLCLVRFKIRDKLLIFYAFSFDDAENLWTKTIWNQVR